MRFLSFFEEFPELVGREFRNITVLDDNNFRYIPPGNYALLECFCVDVECDCRKVMINVVSTNPTRLWTTLNYGWESEQYYRTWWGKNHELYQPMSGVSFDPPTNDPLQNEFLSLFKEIIQTDHNYARRIESHYDMFKEKIQRKRPMTQPSLQLKKVDIEKMRRNDACPCNSGRKFKKCCGFQ